MLYLIIWYLKGLEKISHSIVCIDDIWDLEEGLEKISYSIVGIRILITTHIVTLKGLYVIYNI